MTWMRTPADEQGHTYTHTKEPTHKGAQETTVRAHTHAQTIVTQAHVV